MEQSIQTKNVDITFKRKNNELIPKCTRCKKTMKVDGIIYHTNKCIFYCSPDDTKYIFRFVSNDKIPECLICNNQGNSYSILHHLPTCRYYRSLNRI